MRQRRTKSNARASGVFLLLFALLWCGLIGFLDYELAGMVVRQALTRSYSTGSARILKCEMVRSSSSEGGDTHGLEVLYSYRVGGRDYTSERYAFNAMKSTDSRWAREAVRRHPAGSEAPFYYDPKRPENSVLRRGLDGHDLFVLMFLTPFNAIGVGLAMAAFASLRAAFWTGPALRTRAGRNLREHIDAGAAGPLGGFLAAAGLGSFVGIFVVAFSGGFHPSLAKVGIVWGLVLGLAVWTTVRAWRSRRRGDHEIVIDRQFGTLSLPPMHGRKTRHEVPLAGIESVQAAIVDPPPNRRRRNSSYEVQMIAKNGDKQVLLKPWSYEEAENLAKELGEKLGLGSPNRPAF